MARKYLLLSKERAHLQRLIVLLSAAIFFFSRLEKPRLIHCAALLMTQATLRLHQRLPPHRPLVPLRATISRFDNAHCITLFRFCSTDLHRLLHLLQIPHTIRIGHEGHSSIFSGEEALLVTLRRLSYPCRLAELTDLFGIPISMVSQLFNWTCRFLSSRYGHLLRNMRNWEGYIPGFVAKVSSKGAPNQLGCFGFLDGTLRPTCRPKFGQRSLFSGHRRTHGIKFEMVTLPNGIVAWLAGPYEGRRHDAYVFSVSGLKEQLEELAQSVSQLFPREYCVYADSGYPMNPHVQVPFKGAIISEQQLQYNKTMSAVRECVEWSFGKVVSIFAFLDFKKNLKILLSPVGTLYITGVLLTNFHTCLYGSECSVYFDCEPPSLEEYLQFDE